MSQNGLEGFLNSIKRIHLDRCHLGTSVLLNCSGKTQQTAHSGSFPKSLTSVHASEDLLSPAIVLVRAK